MENVPPPFGLDQSLRLFSGHDTETLPLATFPEYRGASFAVPGTGIPFVKLARVSPASARALKFVVMGFLARKGRR